MNLWRLSFNVAVDDRARHDCHYHQPRAFAACIFRRRCGCQLYARRRARDSHDRCGHLCLFCIFGLGRKGARAWRDRHCCPALRVHFVLLGRPNRLDRSERSPGVRYFVARDRRRLVPQDDGAYVNEWLEILTAFLAQKNRMMRSAVGRRSAMNSALICMRSSRATSPFDRRER